MATSIDPQTTIGPVALTVRDLDRAEAFYEAVVGLRTLEHDGGRARLGVEAGRPLVELAADPDAPDRPRGTTGLYHFAILVPDRAELARALRRVVDARWGLVGASDHLVSEALYLEDSECNGVEIYRDRPRDEWRRDGDELHMATLPLNLRDLIDELGGTGRVPSGTDQGPSPETRVGHVHLNVANLDAAERFYGDLLGFDVTARGYPGALFLSAGGYHHHVGLNTWAGEGAPSPPVGVAGLREFEIDLPDAGELERVVERLRGAGMPVDLRDRAARVDDPSRNRLVLRAAS